MGTVFNIDLTSTCFVLLTSSSMSAGLIGAGRDLGDCLEEGLGEGLGSGLEVDLRADLGSGLAEDLRAGLGSGLEADLALGGECFFCGCLLCTLGFKDVFTFFLGLTVTTKQTKLEFVPILKDKVSRT